MIKGLLNNRCFVNITMQIFGMWLDSRDSSNIIECLHIFDTTWIFRCWCVWKISLADIVIKQHCTFEFLGNKMVIIINTPGNCAKVYQRPWSVHANVAGTRTWRRQAQEWGTSAGSCSPPTVVQATLAAGPGNRCPCSTIGLGGAGILLIFFYIRQLFSTMKITGHLWALKR